MTVFAERPLPACDLQHVDDPLDVEHERLIADAHENLYRATTREARLAAWNTMRVLIMRRSSRQVARMEADRGLV